MSTQPTSRRSRLGAALRDSGRSGKREEPVAGALWVIVAMAFLAAITAFGRYLALSGLDPFQVVFFRNLFCVIWMLPLFAWRGMSLVRTEQLHLYGARVAVSFCAATAMFHAIALIPIGEVTAISFLSPLFGTLFAILLLGEKIRLRRWTALAAGFIGALIMLQPGVSELGAGQMLALVSAMAIGIIGPLVKKLTHVDDADRVVFLTNLLLTPLSLVPALFVWVWPPWELWPYIAGMGLCAVLGHMSLVRGYAATEASLVMTYKFIRLPFAVLLGYLAFGESIGIETWIGGFVIFAASAYVARRESEARRTHGTATTADKIPPAV